MTDQELDRLLSQAAPMARDLWLSSLPGDGELPQEFPKVKDTIPKSTLTLLPEHAVVRLLGIECQFLVTS